ncbi:MAG: sugar phosphate nucleotidyltransferase [Candidatus Micrarchaeia archaeon]
MKQKEKIAISIDPALLARIDAMVDGERVKSRSHAIEMLLRAALAESMPATAVILAGGKGVRPSDRKRAVLSRILAWLGGFGVQEVIVVGNSPLVESAGDAVPSIRFLFEESPRGTAGALALARSVVKNTFLLLYADTLCDFDLMSMLAQHARERPLVTMALTEVKNASRYGAVELEGVRVKGFVEKPPPGKEPSRLVNAGVYVLEPRIFDFLPKSGSLERDVLPELAKAGLVHGFVFTGKWLDAHRGDVNA